MVKTTDIGVDWIWLAQLCLHNGICTKISCLDVGGYPPGEVGPSTAGASRSQRAQIRGEGQRGWFTTFRGCSASDGVIDRSQE